MDQQTLESIDALRRSHPEIDTLVEDHRDLDRRVSELSERSYLTAEQDDELHRLKKQKLRIKDEIERLLHEDQLSA